MYTERLNAVASPSSDAAQQFHSTLCLFGGGYFYHIQCLAPRSATATTTSVLPNMYCLHLH